MHSHTGGEIGAEGSDIGQTISATIFVSDSESEQIVPGYKYGIGAFRSRIRNKYGSVPDIMSDIASKIGLVYNTHSMDQLGSDQPYAHNYKTHAQRVEARN